MYWNMHNDHDLFILWAEKLEPTLKRQTLEKVLNMDATDNEISIWGETVGSKQKKSKLGEIIDAINYLNASTLRNKMYSKFRKQTTLAKVLSPKMLTAMGIKSICTS